MNIKSINLLGLSSALPEHIRQNYSTHEFTVLTIPWRHLEWVSVVLISPKDRCFRALKHYRSFELPLHKWAASQVSEINYKLVLKELRELKVKKSSVPKMLLGSFFAQGGYFGEGPFGKNGNPYFSLDRFNGMTIPAPKLDQFLGYYSRQIDLFGPLAFIDLPEGVERGSLGGDPVSVSLFNETGLNSFELAAPLDKLTSLVKDLENGIDVVPQLMFQHLVSTPCFYHRGSGWKGDFVRVAQINVMRARLVRMLCWPHHYDYVKEKLSDFQAETSVNPIPDLKELTDRVQFELTLYLQEVQTKYPVIVENPLA